MLEFAVPFTLQRHGEMNGLHLIADIYRCRPNAELLTRRAALENLCVSECRNAGLSPLGAYFYQFGSRHRVSDWSDSSLPAATGLPG